MSDSPIIIPGSSATIISDYATADSLVNIVSGAGTVKDKDYHNTFVQDDPLTEQEIEAMYLNDWLAAKVVDAKAHDMIRSWRTVEGLTAEELKLFNEAELAFEIKTKLEEALKLSRKLGGAGIIIGVRDNKDPELPLELDSLGKGSLKYLHVLEKRELVVSEINTDPLSENFRRPAFYQVHNRKIHPSRVIAFKGIKVSRTMEPVYEYWGASIYQKMKKIIGQVNVAYGAGSSMLHEASLDIVSVQGLFHALSNDEGRSKVLKRLQISNLTKSTYNALVKDKDEDFHKITQNFAGIPDMIREMVLGCCGAAETPVTRLLGISPSGLNATGQSDLVNYYDTVASEQNLRLHPKLCLIDKLLQIHLYGSPKKTFKSKFMPLWELTQVEKAEVLAKTMEAHVKSLNVLPLEYIIKAIQRDNLYPIGDDEVATIVTKLINQRKKEAENGNLQEAAQD